MENIKNAIDEVHHNEIKLLVEQGNQLANKKEFKESFESFERAIKINELIENPIFKNKIAIKYEYKYRLIDKAEIEIGNKNFDIAIKDCEKAIELDSTFVDAYFTIGIANTHKKEFKTSIGNYKAVLDLNPNHAKSWNHLGFSYDQIAQFDEAINSFNKAVSIQPNYAEAYYNMGNSYKSKGQFDDAIGAYKKATEINPEFSNAYFFMGVAYFDKNDYYSAIELFNQAIALNSDLSQGLDDLLKDFKKIIKSFNEVLSKKFLNK
jgi:tetratricopeptide (TPR) repeat protein